MSKTEKFEPYQASVSEEILSKWNGTVRVWSEPKSAVEGATVVDEIREPVEVTVVEEQKDMYGSKVQRAKIKYSEGREGWVLADAIVSRK
jgi:predicted transcriptional regulator